MNGIMLWATLSKGNGYEWDNVVGYTIYREWL